MTYGLGCPEQRAYPEPVVRSTNLQSIRPNTATQSDSRQHKREKADLGERQGRDIFSTSTAQVGLADPTDVEPVEGTNTSGGKEMNYPKYPEGH
jgi:hypothetical protein